MNIQVNGKQIDIGQALATQVRTRLEDGVGKYFDGATSAIVTFSREGSAFRADCHVHLGYGGMVKTHGSAFDIYQCFDQAADRLETRLRRYKRRLTDHRQKSRAPSLPVQSYVIAAEPQDAAEPAGDAPAIIAEHETEIPTLSVGEAVMHLELSELNVLVFRNSSHLNVNVVYRRPDGQIGWIDLASTPNSSSQIMQ